MVMLDRYNVVKKIDFVLTKLFTPSHSIKTDFVSITYYVVFLYNTTPTHSIPLKKTKIKNSKLNSAFLTSHQQLTLINRFFITN